MGRCIKALYISWKSGVVGLCLNILVFEFMLFWFLVLALVELKFLQLSLMR